MRMTAGPWGFFQEALFPLFPLTKAAKQCWALEILHTRCLAGAAANFACGSLYTPPPSIWPLTSGEHLACWVSAPVRKLPPPPTPICCLEFLDFWASTTKTKSKLTLLKLNCNRGCFHHPPPPHPLLALFQPTAARPLPEP